MYNGQINSKNSTSIFERIFHRRKKRLFTNMELEFQRYLDIFTIYSIAFILLGVVLAIWNTIPDMILRLFLGFSFVIFTILHFYFFLRRRELSLYRFSIFYALIAFFLGMVSFFQGNIQGVLKLLGTFFLLVSFEHYLEAFYFIRLHDKDVFVLLVSNLLIDFIAFLLYINPFSQLLGGEVLGVFMILFGIIHISELSFLNRKAGTFLTFFES